MLSTAKTTVRSAAKAAGAATTVQGKTRVLKNFLMGRSPSLSAEQQWGDVVERKGHGHQDRGEPQRELHELVWNRPRTGRIIGAGSSRFPVNQVIAIAENDGSPRHEQRLVGGECRQI